MTRVETLRAAIAYRESRWQWHHDQAVRLARDLADLRVELAKAQEEAS